MKRVGTLSGGLAIASLALGAIASAAIAQTATYGTLALETGFGKVQASGSTGGTMDLPRIVNRDRDGQRCLGYSRDYQVPDHLITIAPGTGPITLQVESGKDSTLLVRGPNQSTVRCGDDTETSKDASISGSFEAGTYEVWVGSLQPGDRFRYRLTAQEQ